MPPTNTTFEPPATSTATVNQIDRQRVIARQAQQFSDALTQNCPIGPELDFALAQLRVATFWAYYAVTQASQATGTAR